LKDWQRQKPDLFRKRPYSHTGCDIGADVTRRDVSGDIGITPIEGEIDTATLRLGFRF